MSTSIPPDSAFAAAIRRTLGTYRPNRILETGTYDGMGSTQIFLDYCRANHGTIFRTIECDPENCEKAAAVCGEHLIRGLSIPRGMLPTAEAIRQRIEALPPGIAIDNPNGDPIAAYLAETDKDGPDDLISVSCREFGQPDFALLDSGGHVGQEEVICLTDARSVPVVIALDDTRHLKHWGTLQWISLFPDSFILLDGGQERNGWAILRYDPTTKGAV